MNEKYFKIPYGTIYFKLVNGTIFSVQKELIKDKKDWKVITKEVELQPETYCTRKKEVVSQYDCDCCIFYSPSKPEKCWYHKWYSRLKK